MLRSERKRLHADLPWQEWAAEEDFWRRSRRLLVATRISGEASPCQCITALGRVSQGEPYRFDMGDGFILFRCDVTWYNAEAASIRPLPDHLDLTGGQFNWGYRFRYRTVEISAAIWTDCDGH